MPVVANCPNCRGRLFKLKYEVDDPDMAWGGVRPTRSRLYYCPPCDQPVGEDGVKRVSVLDAQLPSWLVDVLSEVGLTEAQEKRLMESLFTRVHKAASHVKLED